MPKRKLIEVSLPLEAINRESAREKSIRHGHPSTLHLWWARRPLAAARAVLFAQLVDDPSSHPEEFPTEAEQRAERERLHKLIEDLVVWENVRDEKLLAQARAEILKSTGGNPPPIVDPFAGGGTIPLEAQRLGLETHASDLNPVAVLINKALIEIPPRFRDQPPVFPELADTQASWRNAEGLAADVQAYGEWIRDEAEKRIGHLYPKAVLPDGTEAPAIAWVWARTVRCPNPGCGIELPLVRSWWLGKKRGKEAYVEPQIVGDRDDPSGKRVVFRIGHEAGGPVDDPTVAGRQGGVCLACDSIVNRDHIKTEGLAGRMGSTLLVVVAEGERQRHYLNPTSADVEVSRVARPGDVPDQELGFDPRNLWTPSYGLARFADLFTNRQLVALTTFSDLITAARERVVLDGGKSAYADGVATYLALAVSRLADYGSSIATWMPDPKNEGIRNTFARQAVPMSWDFAEVNPFSQSSGNFLFMVRGIVRVLQALVPMGEAQVKQADAALVSSGGALISTDPPYYDNIGYSDLSDYFYVWLRRSLRALYPDLLGTVLVPKTEELVANPYRHGGKDGARQFFEDGFREVFARVRRSARADYPMAVYYAFKQSESDHAGGVSTGWETLLEGMIRSGWAITATWPLRSERSGRMISIDTNALASSIVLALRPRPDDAPTTDRRGFIAALQSDLPDALRTLQQGGIAPVDLPQAAIGPGMAVFSRYSKVVEADGSPMSVHSALARINEILDQVLNEQEGDFDPSTRFALAWYRQHGYATGDFGDADSLARARNTSVAAMDRDQILTSRAGKVTLIRPADTSPGYDVAADEHTSAWEVLHHLIRIAQTEGVGKAGELLGQAAARPEGSVDPDLVKELAFLLFSIAEKNSWTADALAFNTLATSWPDIAGAARSVPVAEPAQAAFNFSDEE